MRVFRELHQFRFLALALAHRELTVRYKRSIFGVLWSLAEPLVLVVVYVGVFGVVFRAADDIANYPLFALFGVLPWLFFASSLEAGTSALLDNGGLIRKIYFPRELLVASVVFSRLSTLIMALIPSLLIAAAAASLGQSVALHRVWWFVPGLLIVTTLALGITLGLSALNVILRDVQFIVRFFLRLAFYAVPIVYSRELVPAAARPIYDINPLVTVVMLFQGVADAALPAPTPNDLVVASLVSLAVLIVGWTLFRRLASAVADAL